MMSVLIILCNFVVLITELQPTKWNHNIRKYVGVPQKVGFKMGTWIQFIVWKFVVWNEMVLSVEWRENLQAATLILLISRYER